MPTQAEIARSEKRRELKERLRVLQEQQADLAALTNGAQEGIITADEFDFAIGLHGLDTPRPRTLFPRTGKRSALQQIADHVRFRKQLQETEANAPDEPRIIEIADFLRDSFNNGVRTVADSTIGFTTMLAELTNPANPVQFAKVLFLGDSEPQQRRRIREAGTQIQDTTLEILGIKPRISSELIANRELAGVPTGNAALLFGDLLGLVAQVAIFKTIRNPEALATVGRAITGTAELRGGTAMTSMRNRVMALQAQRQKIAANAGGVAQQALGADQGRKQLALLGTGAVAGMSTLMFSGPEDPTGMDYAMRAVSGAGLFMLGGSAVIGRPFGPQARALFSQEMKLGYKVAADAERLVGIEASVIGLERAGLRAGLQRFRYRATQGMLFSPRTTVGQLAGSAAHGASWATGKSYSAGADPGEAIAQGVFEGGLWAGTDLLMARIGGVARATALATLFKDNALNTLIAAGMKPATAAKFAGIATPGAQQVAGGVAGAAAGGAIGASLSEDNPLAAGAAGALVGGAAGALLVARTQAHLHSFLPRETVAKILRGDFGQLSREEAGAAAETLLQGSLNATEQALADPILGPVWRHVMGTFAEGRLSGVQKFLPGPRDARNRFASTRFSDSTIATRSELLNEALARANQQALPPSPASASGAARPLPAMSFSTKGEKFAAIYALEIATGRANRLAAKQLPAAAGATGVLKKKAVDVGLLRQHIEVLTQTEKELLKASKRAKRKLKSTGRPSSDATFNPDHLVAVRAERAEVQEMLTTVLTERGGIFDLPALTGTAMGERLGVLREAQQQVLRQLVEAEKRFGETSLSPEVMQLMGKYAGLRDEMAKILELGGMRTEASRSAATEAFRILPPNAPVAARAAVTEGSPFARLADRLATDVGVQKQLRELMGAPRGVASGTGRAVASRGTKLSDTITPGAVSAVPHDLNEMRSFAARNGMDLLVEADPTRLAFVDSTTRATVAAGNSITELMRRMANLASDEAGFVAAEGSISAASGLTGALLGGLVGPSIERLLREDDTSSGVGAVLGIALGGLLGAGGALALARRGSMAMSADARKLLQIVRPEVATPVTRADVGRKFGQVNLAQGPFMRMRTVDQVAHIVEGLSNVSGTQNVTKADRRAQLQTFLRKFTPFELDVATGQYDAVQEAVLTAARKVDMPDTEAATLWRGFLVNITTEQTARPFGAGTATLFDLARRPRHAVNTAAGAAELRDIFDAARTVVGPEPISIAERRARNARIRTMNKVSPHATRLAEFVEEFDAQMMRESGVASDVIPRLLSSIRPMESLRRAAQTLQHNNDPLGEVVMRFFNVLVGAEKNIQRMVEHDQAYIRSVFAKTKPQERKYVRLILEGGSDGTLTKSATEWRAYFTGQNDNLLRTTDQFRQFLDDWAERLQLPKDMLIDEYFPRYYSQTTMREMKLLRPEQRANVGVVGAYGVGIPEEKAFRSAMARLNDEPIGDILDDAMDVANIYGYGAARKFYLDQALEQLPRGAFKQIMRQQPFIGKDIGRWMLDLHGVPSVVDLKMQQMAQSLGLGSEMMARAFGDAAWNRGIAESVAGALNPTKIANRVRGAQFLGKIAFQIVSPLVNMTQLLLNTGTDLSYSSIVKGMFKVGAEKAQESGFKARQFFGPLPDAQAPATPILDSIRETGILSDRFMHQLQWHALEFSTRKGGPIAGGAALGGIAGFVAGDEDNRGRLVLAGALAGGTAGSLFAPVVKRAMDITLGAGTYLFDTVETMNRSITAAAAREEFVRASRLAAAGRTGKLGDVVEGGIVGGVAGGLFGAAQSDEEGLFDKLTSPEAITGAAVGAVALGATTAAGEARALRVSREAGEFGVRSRVKQGMFDDLILGVKRSMDDLTMEQATRWYEQQVVDMTQFRFGRGARGAALRTPMGEMLASLQTYTLNQFEFTGSRIGSLFESGLRGQGVIDTRIFRHIALLMGVGGMLTLATGALDTNRGTEYWISRVGLGFLPFLRYSPRNEEWIVEDAADLVQGPFISDVVRTAQTAAKLMFDPQARQQWDVQADDLFGSILGIIGNATNAAEGTAQYIEALSSTQLEGAAEMLREQETTREIDRPFSTMRRGAPVQRSTGGAATDPLAGEQLDTSGLGGESLIGGGL